MKRSPNSQAARPAATSGSRAAITLARGLQAAQPQAVGEVGQIGRKKGDGEQQRPSGACLVGKGRERRQPQRPDRERHGQQRGRVVAREVRLAVQVVQRVAEAAEQSIGEGGGVEAPPTAEGEQGHAQHGRARANPSRPSHPFAQHRPREQRHKGRGGVEQHAGEAGPAGAHGQLIGAVKHAHARQTEQSCHEQVPAPRGRGANGQGVRDEQPSAQRRAPKGDFQRVQAQPQGEGAEDAQQAPQRRRREDQEGRPHGPGAFKNGARCARSRAA